MKVRVWFSLVAMLLLSALVLPVGAQEEEGEMRGFMFDAPEGYEATTSATNDNVRYDSGDDTIIVFGPDSYAALIGDETFETVGEELAFALDRAGYTVADALDAVPDGATAGVRLTLPRRGQQGYGYYIDYGYGIDGMVISLNSGRRVGANIDDVRTVLGSAQFTANIVELASELDDFSTLVAAVDAAGLVETLSGEGPFTVFAPTNDAFDAALEELGVTLDDLVADTELLTSILTYHVVPGSVLSTDLAEGDVETVNGATFNVAFVETEPEEEGGEPGTAVQLTDAVGRTMTVVATDTEVTNGVIHVIDNVLLPALPAAGEEEAAAEGEGEAETEAETEEAAAPAGDTIVDVVVSLAENQDRDGFSLLLRAVQNADPAVLATLSGEGPYTVFAPNNQAFLNLVAALQEGYGLTLTDLFADENQALLTQVLLYHVVEGDVRAADVLALNEGAVVPTLLTDAQNGIVINFRSSGAPALNGIVDLVQTDVEASNGVVHVIDDVLLPLCVVETLEGTGTCGG